MILEINLQKCANCGACSEICPLNKNRLNYYINIPDAIFKKNGICMQCSPAPCVDSCPSGALHKIDGIIVIDEKKCNLCGICQDVCNYNALFIRYDKDKWSMEKCSLCEGDPLCVKVCPSGALTFKLA
ncbi:MAG: formate hydrogenlyase [Candidatus Nealsonbacteria bacterium]|nr:MAG: formate hydrogenlyase [Candidatus Nealsonbacteria bacterium]